MKSHFISKLLKKIKSSFIVNNLRNFFKGNSKYIIRLDDACETMDLERWEKIELILDELDVKPIVAVIPNNKDESLFFRNKIDTFWELIRSWQEKGWNIALHGYEHKYHKINRKDQYLPLYDRSEFACLNKKKQANKIIKGINIFKDKNITTKIWVAPSHSFDETTVSVIKDHTDIKFISDGMSLFPFTRNKMTYIPQQLWVPFKFPFGVWTICLHPNNMNDIQINQFKKSISQKFFNGKFINLDLIENYISNNNIFSLLFDILFRLKIFIKYILKK